MKILDRLPITEKRTSLRFGDRHTTIHRNQILIWLSIQEAGAFEPGMNIPTFPAIVDTGQSFGFAVQERQLREWAGIDPAFVPVLGEIEINGQLVTRRRATVWMYPNIPSRQEVDSASPPLRLNVDKCIAVRLPNAFNAWATATRDGLTQASFRRPD